MFRPIQTIAQKSKQQLEQEKRENLQKIKEAEKILQATESQKKFTIGQLNAINQQIEAREALIQSTTNELKFLDKEIGEIGILILALENDLQQLKKEYASMLYAANKAKDKYGKLAFLFSSKTFHQLIMRIQYMHQYSEARKMQVEQITKVKETLSVQRLNVEKKKVEKDKLLKGQIQQSRELISLKNKQGTIINNLGNREKEIKQELEQRKGALEKLDKLITDIIKKETELAEKEKAKGAIASKNESASLSTTFEGLKKKLIWPVTSGIVSGKFGTQPHPVLKGIFVENTGIDIQTEQNEKVRTVFDGKVSVVASIRGLNGVVVIIQHGDYRTVYANLSKAYVKAGQEVTSKDFIGEVYTDKDGHSELRFEIWKNYEKLDPLLWLGAK